LDQEPIPLCVVLVSPRNPLNIGAAARAMSNFGFHQLRLVNAYEVAFREARSAVNAAAVLQQAACFSSLSEAVADCGWVMGATGLQAREVAAPVQRLERARALLLRQAAHGRVALVFGSEKHGLSRQDISHCHQLAHIPTRPGHDSMNLGQAVAVCLYELIRETDAVANPSPLRSPLAPQEVLDRLHREWSTVLVETGYAKPRVALSVDRKLRLLLRRMHLGEKDATQLLGVARQCLLALRNGRIREKALREWQQAPKDPVS
jgi:tRNA/rRNA methyltransferase